MKTLKEISTHKAIRNGDKIEIWLKGINIPGLVIEDEPLYSIPAENEEDLFAIFERYEENNRCNLAEANREFAGSNN